MAHHVSHQAAGEIPLVTSVDVELHLRCKCQRITLSDVVGGHQLVGDFGIEQRERAANTQSWQGLGKPGDIAFQAHHLCICGVVREEKIHNAGVKDRCLEFIDLNKEGTTVEAEGASGHISLPTKLVVCDFVSCQLKRHLVASSALCTTRSV